MKLKYQHVLIIPDGNRRWAKLRGLSYEDTYQLVARKTSPDLIRFFLIEGRAKEFTLFFISRYNVIKRDYGSELKPIFEAQAGALNTWSQNAEFQKAKIKFNVMGDLSLLPKYYLDAIKKITKATKKFKGPVCNILVAYDGEWELMKAFDAVCRLKARMTEKAVRKHLLLKKDIDLVIRSGYEKRLSGCPLLQIKYAELFFLDLFYPELTPDHLLRVLKVSEMRSRRFGA